jgi:hypothetical protein
MIEEIYEGTNKKQLFQNIRLGIVKKVNVELRQDDVIAGKHSYGSLDVDWIENGLTVSKRVPLMFPYAGDGWGIYSYPEIGDLLIAAFRQGGYPIALGYVNKNSISQLGQIDWKTTKEVILNSFGEQQPNTEVSFVPIRPLISGEIFIRSREMSEIYLDRNGSFRLIARKKRTQEDGKNIPRRVFEMILGDSYGDDLKTAILDKFGKIYNFYLKHIKGSSLGFNERGDLTLDVKGTEDDEALLDLTVQKQIDIVCGNVSLNFTKEGLIDIKNIAGQQILMDQQSNKVTIKDQSGSSIILDGNNITLNGSNINIGGESLSNFAVLGNSLLTKMNSILTSIKNHVHTSGAPGNPTSPSPTLIVLQDIQEQEILSSKVKVQ